MLRQILLGVVVLIVVIFAGRWLIRSFASDETRIRWLVEAMEEGYNDGRVRPCVDPLADEWTHAEYALDRETLKAALARRAMLERDQATKELLSQVEVDHDSVAVAVEGTTASLTVDVLFRRQRAGEWNEAWKLRIRAELEERDGDWTIVGSRHEDLEGTQLSR